MNAATLANRYAQVLSASWRARRPDPGKTRTAGTPIFGGSMMLVVARQRASAPVTPKRLICEHLFQTLKHAGS